MKYQVKVSETSAQDTKTVTEKKKILFVYPEPNYTTGHLSGA